GRIGVRIHRPVGREALRYEPVLGGGRLLALLSRVGVRGTGRTAGTARREGRGGSQEEDDRHWREQQGKPTHSDTSSTSAGSTACERETGGTRRKLSPDSPVAVDIRHCCLPSGLNGAGHGSSVAGQGAVALGDRWAAPERWPDYSVQIVTATSKAVRSWWRAG